MKKVAGVAHVIKLRVILFIEADTNQHDKQIFRHHVLVLARAHDMVPEEIMSTKGKTAEDAILLQVLVYDVAHQ